MAGTDVFRLVSILGTTFDTCFPKENKLDSSSMMGVAGVHGPGPGAGAGGHRRALLDEEQGRLDEAGATQRSTIYVCL